MYADQMDLVGQICWKMANGQWPTVISSTDCVTHAMHAYHKILYIRAIDIQLCVKLCMMWCLPSEEVLTECQIFSLRKC